MYRLKWRVLPRQAIVRTLAKSIASHFLTVVTAPAGYGKTTVAHSLTGKKQMRRFFHSVPAGISDAEQWWESLCESLLKQGMEHAPALRRNGFPQNDFMLRRVVDLLEGVSPSFLLILDDFHNFRDSRVDAFVAAMTRAEPASHRLVLFSRTKPEIPFKELEKRGLAAVYDQRLLEFSESDAVRFFFLNGVADKKSAKRAWRYSEGWATALWLCLHNRQTGREMPPSTGIEHLLDEAVFAAYPAEDQDFLIRLSVLDAFTSKEAEALTNDAATAGSLRRMADGNALIRHEPAEDRYIFHSIFRDFLEKKLAARAGMDLPDLYRRAAECHIRRGESAPAYRLLVKAGRDEDLLRILDSILLENLQSTYSIRRSEFLPVIEKIPWRLRLKQPLGYLTFIWFSFDDAIDDPLATRMLEEAAERFARAKSIPHHLRRRLAGEVEFMRGWAYTNNELHLLPVRYEKACALLGGPSIIRYEGRCWNFSSPHMLFVYLFKGLRYLDAAKTARRASPPLSMLTGGVSEGCERIAQIEYHMERAEVDTAQRLVDDLEHLLDFPWNMSGLIMARFTRARLASLAGEGEKAVAILKEILRDVEAMDFPEHIQCAELALGYLLANDGDPWAAPQWLQDRDIFEQQYGVRRIQAFMVTVCGKLLLAKGDLDGLEKFLSVRQDIFGPENFTFASIHAAAFKAILACRRNEPGKALKHLREAVENSRPDGFILPLAEYGGHLLPLLHRLKKKMPKDPHLAKITGTAEKIEAVRQRRKNGTKYALTAKEHDIMRLVIKGRPTSVIADKLGFSESVVKHTLTSAYRKLGAKNRAEAARLFPHHSTRESPQQIRGSMPADVPPDMNHAKQALAARCFTNEGAGYFMRLKGESVRSSPPEEGRMDNAAGDRATGEGLLRRGDLADAFYFFLKAGRDEDLARSLELFLLPASARMTAHCFEEVRAAVQLFPWSVRLLRPKAYLAFLWRCFRVFHRGTSTMELDEVEYRLSQAKAGTDLAGELALLRSLHSSHDATALWDGHDAALALLDGPSDFYTPETSWTFSNPQLSFTLVREPGEFGKLAKRAASASKTLSSLSGGRFASMGTAFRLERHLERGETAEALALLPDLEACENDKQALILAAFSRSRLLMAEGRQEQATDALERLLPLVGGPDDFELAESLDLALAYIHAHPGRFEKTPQWIWSGQTNSPPHGGTVRCPFASVVQGKTLLAAGDFAALASVARVMPARFGRHNSLLGRIHAKVLEALAAHYHREEDKALAHLAAALELSRPDGLIFSIAEYGESALPLLRRLRRDNPGDSHVRRITLLADKIHHATASGKENAHSKHILTLREREIMRLVVQGKSNAAIAEALGVSGSRITKALSGIYGKLGVSNRAEASRYFDEQMGNAIKSPK